MKEWWSGAHSVFENGSERVSALIFSLMSESWAKLKKLMSVEHVELIKYLFLNSNMSIVIAKIDYLWK